MSGYTPGDTYTSPTYTNGAPVHQGQIVVTEAGEHAYTRVIGTKGFVTVYSPDWETARVFHITELTPFTGPLAGRVYVNGEAD